MTRPNEGIDLPRYCPTCGHAWPHHPANCADRGDAIGVLADLLDRDCAYVGLPDGRGEIRIPAASHAGAIRAMRAARAALIGLRA